MRSIPIYSSFSYTTATKDGSLTGMVHAFPASREHATMSNPTDLLKHEPLSQRGWALQERLLAKRILHFCKAEMMWECHCHFITETGYYSPCWEFSLPAPTPNTTEPTPFTPTVQLKAWSSILHRYPRLSLPHPSDKLPALSNIAAAFHTTYPDTYVAGFWRKSLLESLMWQAIGSTTGVSGFRAPTWSWACMDGPFGIFVPGVGFDKGTWRAIGRIESCDIELEDPQSPFGQVRSASLKMSAPLVRLVPAEPPTNEPFPQKQKGVKIKVETSDSNGSYAFFDTPQHAERARGKELSALVLMGCEVDGGVGCGDDSCGTSRELFHCVIVARVEAKGEEGGDEDEKEEREERKKQLPMYERLGKIVFVTEDFDATSCPWLSGEYEHLERFVFV